MLLCLLQTRQDYDLCEGCRYFNEADIDGPYDEIAPIAKVVLPGIHVTHSHQITGLRHLRVLACCWKVTWWFWKAAVILKMLCIAPAYGLLTEHIILG